MRSIEDIKKDLIVNGYAILADSIIESDEGLELIDFMFNDVPFE